MSLYAALAFRPALRCNKSSISRAVRLAGARRSGRLSFLKLRFQISLAIVLYGSYGLTSVSCCLIAAYSTKWSRSHDPRFERCANSVSGS